MSRTVLPFDQWPIQNRGLEPLFQRLSANEVPHAMLFLGEPAVTHPFADFLANLLLCTGEVAPCGTCPSCLQFKAKTHPDHYVIDGDADTALKAGDVEGLQSGLALRPHGGQRIVYTLRGIDRATAVAANRLLKTLEEPSDRVVALLTARQRERILPTILSRTMIYRLSDTTASSADTESEETPLERQAAGTLSVSEGFVEVLPQVIQWTQALIGKDGSALEVADRFLEMVSPLDASDGLWLLSQWLRDVLYWRLNDTSHIQFQHQKAALQHQASLVSPKWLMEAIPLVVQARSRLQSHVAVAVNLEQMCIQLWRVAPNV